MNILAHFKAAVLYHLLSRQPDSMLACSRPASQYPWALCCGERRAFATLSSEAVHTIIATDLCLTARFTLSAWRVAAEVKPRWVLDQYHVCGTNSYSLTYENVLGDTKVVRKDSSLSGPSLQRLPGQGSRCDPSHSGEKPLLGQVCQTKLSLSSSSGQLLLWCWTAETSDILMNYIQLSLSWFWLLPYLF